MSQLTYPTHGRGAWSSIGGTLSADGTQPGIYYRNPTGAMQMPGLLGYRAVHAGSSIDVNSYAVYMAVKAIQREAGATEDGLYGPGTAAAVKSWQIRHGLDPDGILGRVTARAMFHPLAVNAAHTVSSNSIVAKLTCGHVGYESSWDAGAIGYAVPQDLGLGQVNGPAHPDLSADFRLTPRLVLSFVANFVLDNLEAMDWNERDAIAAYNLGVAGARNWVKAGRPDVFNGTDVAGYIAGVLANVN